MKSNIIIILVLICLCLKSYCQVASGLLVERYRTSDFGGSFTKPITVLNEKRKYAEDKKLIYKIEYKSKLFFDSTVYKFDHGKLVRLTKFTNFNVSSNLLNKIEDVGFIYENKKVDYVVEMDSHEKITNSERKEYFFNYLKDNNIFFLKDSLQLLDKEFNDINLPDIKEIKIQGDTNKVIEKDYVVKYLPNILFEYGVPHHIHLKKIRVYYTKYRLLTKVEFLYYGLTVRKEYHYLNNLINNIRVLVLDENHKTIRDDLIWFDFKPEL